METKDNAIIQGDIRRQLLIFFFPILLGTFFQQLYTTVDAAIVGSVLGKQALAAVGGTTGMLINLITGFFIGLSSGAAVLLSHAWGAGDGEGVKKTIHTGMALALWGGALIMVLGEAIAPAALHAMGTPEDVMGPAVTYLRVAFLGMVPLMVYNIGFALMRAMGDSRKPLIFLAVSSVMNIVLDVVLVMLIPMGVAGAALATVLSQVAAAWLVIGAMHRADGPQRLVLKELRMERSLLKRMTRIGLPGGLQSMMYCGSNLLIQAVINGFGTTVMAAWTVYSRLDGVFWMTVSSFGVALTSFAGQNFGAGLYDRVRRSLTVCIRMATVVTILISAATLIWDEELARIFTDDPQVIEKSLEIVRLIVPTFITYVCIEVYSGVLRGCGDTLIPTIITLLGVCVLRLVWVLGLSGGRSLSFMLLCYPVTWTVTSLLFLFYYYRTGWMERCRRAAR